MPTSKSTAILIRSVRKDDFSQWLALWNGYNEFYGRHGITALPEEVTLTTWSRFFDTHEPMHALVAEIDGQLAGLAHYLFHRSTIAIQPTCYLQDLFTLASLRGRGVARGLIKEVYGRVQGAGSARVYWMTHQTNTAARRLYDQLAEDSGFVVYRKAL